jgi:enamine deaminase RidA (YjgF/YER057c/UK114 family)
MALIEARLKQLKITLPEPRSPVANFVPCMRVGNAVFVSGQITAWNGDYLHIGKVGREIPLDEAKDAARVCALNVISQLKNFLGDLDKVQKFAMVQGFVNAIPEFEDHPKVINGASDLFVEVFGEAGRHARFAIGVASLPFNVAVEIAAVVEVR